MGATVAITSASGKGFPDLVVGYHGVNLLVEVKDGSKPPSKRRLSPAEIDFHTAWLGQICVVESVDEAIELIVDLRASLEQAIGIVQEVRANE